jgi:hypothetical protein
LVRSQGFLVAEGISDDVGQILSMRAESAVVASQPEVPICSYPAPAGASLRMKTRAGIEFV